MKLSLFYLYLYTRKDNNNNNKLKNDYHCMIRIFRGFLLPQKLLNDEKNAKIFSFV